MEESDIIVVAVCRKGEDDAASRCEKAGGGEVHAQGMNWPKIAENLEQGVNYDLVGGDHPIYVEIMQPGIEQKRTFK